MTQAQVRNRRLDAHSGPTTSAAAKNRWLKSPFQG
jgi:hypothetical protein